MGIDSIGSAVSNYFGLSKTAEAAPAAPPPAAPVAAEAKTVVPAQYQSGFDAAPVTGGPTSPQVSAEIAKPFIDMNNKIADVYIKNGDYEKARAMNESNKKFVQSLGLGETNVDTMSHVESATAKDDVGPHFAKGDHMMSFNQVTELKDAQIAQAQKMSKAVGKTVDPSNLSDVKSYFDTLSKKAPTAQVQKEFSEYVKNNYADSRYTWPAEPPKSQRDTPGVVTEMFAKAPKDMAGRPAIDCEGMTYLTGSIFQKNPKFEVVYSSSASHIAAAVFEKGKTKGFSVDASRKHGDKVQAFESPNEAMNDRARVPKSVQQNNIAKGVHGMEKPSELGKGGDGNGSVSRDLAQANVEQPKLRE